MPLHPHSLFQQFPANFPSLLASLGFPSSSTCKESTGSAGDPPVQFLGQEDPLEKGEATHSSALGLPCWLSR